MPANWTNTKAKEKAWKKAVKAFKKSYKKEPTDDKDFAIVMSIAKKMVKENKFYEEKDVIKFKVYGRKYGNRYPDQWIGLLGYEQTNGSFIKVTQIERTRDWKKYGNKAKKSEYKILIKDNLLDQKEIDRYMNNGLETIPVPVDRIIDIRENKNLDLKQYHEGFMKSLSMDNFVTTDYLYTYAGVLPYCKKTKRFLVGRRGPKINNAGQWNIFGGSRDGLEPVDYTALREFVEETGFTGNIYLSVIADDGEHMNYIGHVETEFKPILNMETDKTMWVTLKEMRYLKPLHKSLKATLERL